MEVWVAGATGVLGRQIIPQLLAAGHTVVGLARDTSKWPDAPPEMTFIPCDITAPGQVIRAFADATPGAILHLASAIPAAKPTAKDWARNDAVRRDGTRSLLEIALVKEAYFVHQSVHYVYAPEGDKWIDETAPFGNIAVIQSAIDAERLVNKAFNQGLHGCIMRPSTFYTAESPQTRLILQELKTGRPILIGNGQNYWSFVHPADVAGAILRVLDVRPPNETYNVTDNEPIHMADALKWLAQEMHVKPPKSVAPFLAKLAIGGETVDLLIGSRRLTNAKAKAELGWEPRFPTFREGFAKELPRVRFS